jgi:hypothetical protein
MSFAGLIIELLVGTLLAVTIGYCALLNRRLKKMRADEDVMRSIITELVKSTETAERAILGLRATASECNKTISARITEARDIVAQLDHTVASGRHIAQHIGNRAPSTPQHSAPHAQTHPQVQPHMGHQMAPPVQHRAPEPLAPQFQQRMQPIPQTSPQTAPQPTPQANAQPRPAELNPQQIAMVLARERDRLAAAEAAEVAFDARMTPPMAMNDVHPEQAPTARSTGLYDDLEASLAEIARRNKGVAA